MVEVLPAVSEQERYTPAQIVEVVKQTRGMVTAAAQMLGCDRKTIYNYRDKYPVILEALATAKELQLDTAELNLFKCIDRSEPWAICFYLKTIGRHRGYVEKHEIIGTMTLEEAVLASYPQPGNGKA